MQSVVPQKSYDECKSCEYINDFDNPVCMKCGSIIKAKRKSVVAEMEEIGFQAGEISSKLMQFAGFCIYLSVFGIFLFLVTGKWTIWCIIPLCISYAVFFKLYYDYKLEFSNVAISDADFNAAKSNENFAWFYIAVSIVLGFGTIFL